MYLFLNKTKNLVRREWGLNPARALGIFKAKGTSASLGLVHRAHQVVHQVDNSW